MTTIQLKNKTNHMVLVVYPGVVVPLGILVGVWFIVRARYKCCGLTFSLVKIFQISLIIFIFLYAVFIAIKSETKRNKNQTGLKIFKPQKF